MRRRWLPFLRLETRRCGLGEPLLAPAIVARVLDRLAIRRDEEHFQADINARLASGGWEWLGWHVGARDDGVPAIGFVGDGDGFGRAFEGAAPADGDTANLGQHKAAVLW